MRMPTLAARSARARSLVLAGGIGGLSAMVAAAAVALVLRDSGNRDALVRAGLARAGEFTWERTARETLRCYARLGAAQR